MDEDGNDMINELLQGYEKELSRLHEQQRLLQDAPTTFGEFASRVHAEVERRSAADRRAAARATPDRRAASPGSEESSM